MMQLKLKGIFRFIFILVLIILHACQSSPSKIRVIFDTDTNNELDDQHALAYLLFNGKTFDVEGITINATSGGGNIDMQYDEAKRVVQLCGLFGKIPLYKGANGPFDSIRNEVDNLTFDGSDAVDFIIKQIHAQGKEKLVLIAVGKLTTVACAIKKDPSIAQKVRLVWLGSNYPEPGEYNQANDTAALNYLLNSQVHFEMVTVRARRYSGTYAVSTNKEEIRKKMPGKGPHLSEAIIGRHGGTFNNFGDYSVNLFDHIGSYGIDFSRPLYDMAAIAIVKNPGWAYSSQIPAPILINKNWIERPANKRMITIWDHFDKESIINDFFTTMDKYVLVESKK